jgi:hypothetical protein
LGPRSGKGAAPTNQGQDMSEHRKRLEFRLAARIMNESCESCMQREFDFIIEDAFVCETCAWEG